MHLSQQVVKLGLPTNHSLFQVGGAYRGSFLNPFNIPCIYRIDAKASGPLWLSSTSLDIDAPEDVNVVDNVELHVGRDIRGLEA